MAKLFNKILREFGFEVKRYPNPDLTKRIKLINHFSIDLVLDIGASVGEYGKTLRNIGYKKRILSFEPIKSSYNTLLRKSNSDDLWEVYNYGLGNENCNSQINISKNFDSSSILEISELHTSTNEESMYVNIEDIEIKKLETIFPLLHKNEKNIFLKLDTQGYELKVLLGAGDLLKNAIKGIQIEMSIVPLYSGSVSFMEIINYLKDIGFVLYGIEPGFYDKKSGRLLQFDGIFIKE